MRFKKGPNYLHNFHYYSYWLTEETFTFLKRINN